MVAGGSQRNGKEMAKKSEKRLEKQRESVIIHVVIESRAAGTARIPVHEAVFPAVPFERCIKAGYKKRGSEKSGVIRWRWRNANAVSACRDGGAAVRLCWGE